MRPATDTWLSFLSRWDKPGRGAEPIHSALAGDAACALVCAGLRSGLDAAWSRSCLVWQHLEHVPAVAFAHRRAAAHPLWHRAHRTAADSVAIGHLPRSGQARPINLVALRAHRPDLWGELVGLCRPDSGRDPGADCCQIAASAARGDRNAGLCGGPGVPFLLVGLLVDRASTFLRRIRRYTVLFSSIGGAILILVGISLLLGLFSTYG